jgi:hypothetical protein
LKAEYFTLPDELDQRLREWADYHRDRRRYLRCGSLEGRYKRMAGEDDGEGWGDVETAPEAVRTRPRDWILRAIETNELIMDLQLIQRWAVTYAYAYPGLPKFVVLRALKKFTKRHLTWKEYLDQVDIARFRLWANLVRRAA